MSKTVELDIPATAAERIERGSRPQSLFDAIETIAREAVVRWMIEHSYATGHGDTLDDVLRELIAQVAERVRKER